MSTRVRRGDVRNSPRALLAARAAGRTKVLRETFDYTHSATLRFPFWATHRYLIKPDHSRLKAAAETMWKDGPTPSQVAMSTPWPWNVAE